MSSSSGASRPFQDPEVVEVWDKVAKVYGRIDPSAPDHQANLLRFLEAVGSPEGRTFCEVGCGSGTTSAALAKLGARVTLVDLSAKALDFACDLLSKMGSRFHAIRQNGLQMGIRDGAFDVVWNGGVIEHFTDDGKIALMKEMYRIVKPGGLLVIIVPNADGWPFMAGKWIAQKRGKWIFGFEDDLSAKRFRGLAQEADIREYELAAHNPVVGWWFLPYGKAVTDRLGLNTVSWHAKRSRTGHSLRFLARKPSI